MSETTGTLVRSKLDINLQNVKHCINIIHSYYYYLTIQKGIASETPAGDDSDSSTTPLLS